MTDQAHTGQHFAGGGGQAVRPKVQPRSVQAPPSYRDPSRDEVLLRALHRADRAMEMVDRMQDAMQRSNKRQKIEKAIARKQIQRGRTDTALQIVFFANFWVLGLAFYFGAGVLTGSMGNWVLNIARAAGLISTYLLLVQLLFVARVPALDRVYGLDRLTRWHRVNGHISFDLALLHAYCAVAGRALNAEGSLVTAWSEVVTYKFMVPAVIGLMLMAAAIATSIVSVRKRVGHGKWHWVHLWTYVGVALSFGHQLYGPDLEGNVVSQAYLWALYIGAFAIVAWSRLVTPIINTFKYQLRVAKVKEEGSGVTSLYMTGFRLDRLGDKPGQFCWWRFLTPREWRKAHPFSLSTAPNGKYLRITVKSLGDFSSRVNTIAEGTWVTFEGPFGGFTPDKRTRVKTVLVAGGVGVTPIRSLLEGMPSAAGDIAVIYRADKVEDAVLLHELEDLAAKREAELHLVLGSRDQWPADKQPLSAGHFRYLVPDIAKRDVYICAAPGMTAAVRGTLKSMGLRDQQVHHESFS